MGLRKRNRQAGEWKVVPPQIDPLDWPVIIFFGTLVLAVIAGSIAGMVLIVEKLW